jgi:hypothetical protein
LFGVVYPGVAAYLGGVFSEDQLRRTIEIKSKSNLRLQEQLDKLQKYETNQEVLSNKIAKIESHLATLEIDPTNLAQVERAISVYRAYKALQNQQKEAAPPIRLGPFNISSAYISSTLLLWPALYTFLGWLILIFPPPLNKESSGGITIKNIFLLTASIVLLYRWPTWWRNTPLGQGGRIYYGANNFDVDPFGFFVQESLGAMTALLVAIVWLQWSAYCQQVKTQLSKPHEEPIDEALKPEISEDLSHLFLHWQIASILLTLAFLWYPVFFWQMVFRFGDYRYLPQAIIVHSMWVITWIIISLPLLITSYQWHKVHARAIASLAKENLPKGYDPGRLAAALEKVQPISSWNVAASGIAVAVSLLAPFVSNLLH